MSWPAFREAVTRSSGDADLSRDLADALRGDTDDVRIG
jgi:hypothetical protein